MNIIKKNLSFFLLALAVFPCFLFSQHTAPAPVSEEVGIEEHLGDIIPLDLTFTDSSGTTLKLGDIISKPTVLTLVYFHCPTVCKPLLGAVVDGLDRIDNIPGKDYQAITISFNEKEDTEHAKTVKDSFIKRFNKPFPETAWHFMIGDAASIRKITAAVGFKYKRDGEDFIHPTTMILLSPKGKITRYFNGMSYPPFDLKMGLLEASEGRTGPTINKLLLFCFRYDPEGKRYVFDILKVTGTITIFFGLIFVAWLVISTRKKRKEKKEK